MLAAGAAVMTAIIVLSGNPVGLGCWDSPAQPRWAVSAGPLLPPARLPHPTTQSCQFGYHSLQISAVLF